MVKQIIISLNAFETGMIYFESLYGYLNWKKYLSIFKQACVRDGLQTNRKILVWILHHFSISIMFLSIEPFPSYQVLKSQGRSFSSKTPTPLLNTYTITDWTFHVNECAQVLFVERRYSVWEHLSFCLTQTQMVRRGSQNRMWVLVHIYISNSINLLGRLIIGLSSITFDYKINTGIYVPSLLL